MERQLATVQKIRKLSSIVGADRIECAEILGWECVVTKEDFKEGDLCIYFEIDSQLPINPIFDFMANRHYRVKTAKFKKQISQGLAMPLTVLDHFIKNSAYNKTPVFKEGMDVTEIIGVTKHDPRPEDSNPTTNKKNGPILNYLLKYSPFRAVYKVVVPKKTSGNFPSFINKTDETRIQSCPSLLRKNINVPFYFTEKLDGSSSTYFYNKKLVGKRFGIFTKDKGNGFGVCSRNLRLVHPDNSYWWQCAKNYNFEKLLKELSSFLNCSVAIQGEIIGPAIQENKYKRNSLEFFCYNIFNIDTQEYLNYTDKFEIFKMFNIPFVPVVNKFVLSEEHDVPFLVKLSDMESNIKRDVLAEGIVGRSMLNDAVSFKVINPKWLLKYKE